MTHQYASLRRLLLTHPMGCRVDLPLAPAILPVCPTTLGVAWVLHLCCLTASTTRSISRGRLQGKCGTSQQAVTAEAKSTFFHIDILPSNNETTTEASTCLFHRGQNQLYAVGYLGNNTTSAAHERTVAGISTASVRSFLKYRRCSAPPEMLTQKA